MSLKCTRCNSIHSINLGTCLCAVCMSYDFSTELFAVKAELAEERRVLARVLDILADWTDWKKDVGILTRGKDFHSSHAGCCRCSTCNRHHDECVCPQRNSGSTQ